MSNDGFVSRSAARQVGRTCLCLHTQRAARALARRFDAALQPVGLNNGQFSLMMALSRPDPRPLSDVAAFLAMDRTTLTAKLKPLERHALVRIEPDQKDRRVRLLSLTEAGRARLAAALPIWQAEHQALEQEAAAISPPFDPDRLRADLNVLAER